MIHMVHNIQVHRVQKVQKIHVVEKIHMVQKVHKIHMVQNSHMLHKMQLHTHGILGKQSIYGTQGTGGI